MMKKTALVMAVCLGLTISFPGAARAANGSTIKVVSMNELEKDYPELGNSGKPDLNGRQTINSGKVKKADKSAEKNNKKKKEIKDRKKKDNSQKIRMVFCPLDPTKIILLTRPDTPRSPVNIGPLVNRDKRIS